MNAALYGRVSTFDQELSSQMAQCREWCSRNGIEAKEFIDKASGGTMARPAMDKMMAEIRRGSIKLIVVYKMDRLGRSLMHLAQFIGEMDSLGVSVVCISQGVDTRKSNPAGRMQMQMLMVFAEFERSLIRERTTAGLRAAKERGVRLGRPEGSALDDLLPAALAAQRKGVGLRAFARENKVAESTLRRVMKQHKAL